MIHEISTEVATRLKAAGCPIEVVDGPPWAETTWGGERIMFTLDEGGDSFGPVQGTHVNPRLVAVRSVAFFVRISAQSKRAGALFFEHTRRVEAILDQVIVALSDVCRLREQPLQIRSGKWLPVKDLEKSTMAAGAVYELSATVGRGISRKNWQGEAAEEITITEGLIKTTAYASAKGGDPTDSNDDGVPDNAETIATEV